MCSPVNHVLAVYGSRGVSPQPIQRIGSIVYWAASIYGCLLAVDVSCVHIGSRDFVHLSEVRLLGRYIVMYFKMEERFTQCLYK